MAISGLVFRVGSQDDIHWVWGGLDKQSVRTHIASTDPSTMHYAVNTGLHPLCRVSMPIRFDIEVGKVCNKSEMVSEA